RRRVRHLRRDAMRDDRRRTEGPIRVYDPEVTSLILAVAARKPPGHRAIRIAPPRHPVERFEVPPLPLQLCARLVVVSFARDAAQRVAAVVAELGPEHRLPSRNHPVVGDDEGAALYLGPVALQSPSL